MKKWIQRSFRNRMFTAMLLAALLPLLLGGALMLRLQVVRIESGLARQADLRLRELEAALTEVYAACGDLAEDLAGSTVVHSALRRGGTESRTLYQVLYRSAEPLRDCVRFDIYDGEGRCLYTSGGSLPAETLDTGWGLLPAARASSGIAVRTGAEEGLSAARAVRGQIFLSRWNYSPQVLEARAKEAPSPEFRALLEEQINPERIKKAMSVVNGAVSNLLMLLVSPYLPMEGGFPQ